MEFTQGVRFDSLGLTEEVQRALKKKNIEESTPVQAFLWASTTSLSSMVFLKASS